MSLNGDDMNTYRNLFLLAYTTQTSRIRDWLNQNGYIAYKPDILYLLAKQEQEFVQIPDYLLFYAMYVAEEKIKKYNSNVWTYIVEKSQRYQILLYIFVKTDYPFLEKFMDYSRNESFNEKVVRYCFKHRRYEDLILKMYVTKTYLNI